MLLAQKSKGWALYIWSTFRDAGSITISATHSSQLFKKRGWIYGQLYNQIENPFDSAKMYIFNNDNLENIALDPAYVRTLHKEGKAVSFT